MPNRRRVPTRKSTHARGSWHALRWWWAGIGVLVTITLGIACWRLVESIAGGSAALRIEAIKVGLSVAAGAGGACTLLLAFRRQLHSEHVAQDLAFDASQRRITELYTKAVEQLGHDKAAVRLGGLYALERLAQDNQDQRQTVADVICAYIRMPFSLDKYPAPDDAASAESTGEYHQEFQVREAAQRILARHLLSPELASGAPYWAEINIDLNGAELFNVDFSTCKFDDVDFTRANFNGESYFSDSEFVGTSRFNSAHFHDAAYWGASFREEASFDGAEFHKNASFGSTEFLGGCTFDGTLFNGNAGFTEVNFRYASFEKAQFCGNANFSSTKFGWSKFADSHFHGPRPDFTGATIEYPKISSVPESWRIKPSDDETGSAVVLRRIRRRRTDNVQGRSGQDQKS